VEFELAPYIVEDHNPIGIRVVEGYPVSVVNVAIRLSPVETVFVTETPLLEFNRLDNVPVEGAAVGVGTLKYRVSPPPP